MPWHLSRSNPMKVYDERHTEVCVCCTAEAAALIVQGVNALPYESRGTFVKLREAQLAPQPVSSTVAPRQTHTTIADGCCGRQIGKASLAGRLESVTKFECPTCGTTYESRTEGPLTVWEARADVLVFRSR